MKPKRKTLKATADAAGRERLVALRDKFAAAALQAEIITTWSDATPEIRAADQAGISLAEHIARNSYRWADAMLKAREAKS